jgi:hypothetical protein
MLEKRLGEDIRHITGTENIFQRMNNNYELNGHRLYDAVMKNLFLYKPNGSIYGEVDIFAVHENKYHKDFILNEYKSRESHTTKNKAYHQLEKEKSYVIDVLLNKCKGLNKDVRIYEFFESGSPVKYKLKQITTIKHDENLVGVL